MANKNNLLLLFDRPKEPVFMPKGEKGSVFDVPDNFLSDRYRPIGNEIQTRFGEGNDRISVRNTKIPDLNEVLKLPRDANFSLWTPAHRRYAGLLIDIFMGADTVDNLQSIAVYARDRVNPHLFNYALSVAILHRSDTKNMDLPLYAEAFPDKFLDSRTIGKLREEATVVPQGSRMPIIIPRDYTASDLEEEHRLYYFREDLGINLHHWHWHLVYPFESQRNRQIVDKDRRGELFYYMHQQLMARYNFERFCNGMNRTLPLSDFRAPIKEGYFPKLDSLVASRSWPGRITNATLKDLDRKSDQLTVTIAEMEKWRDEFLRAARQGFYVDERGNRITLTEDKGIDILGNMMESSVLSPNRRLYGDMHNYGHLMLSYIHDPDHRHLETFGVMGDTATSMRDPAFYRLHALVDDCFQVYLQNLAPYSPNQLTFPGINIVSAQVQSEGLQPNVFQTFWQQSDVNMTNGLDFAPRGNVFVRYTHLQHVPFNYNIQVNNASGSQRLGMVRIFIAPKFDERGQPIPYRDQRRMMVELERFIAALRPGQNTIRRRSVDSNVTVPYERTFRSLANKPAPESSGEAGFNFCGCGWPQHMLIPRGNTSGYRAELFVMISDYEQDRVDQNLSGQCSDAASYCGVRDRKYPDRKPMGYPFDRFPAQGVNTLSQFLTPNMRVQDVNIVLNDRRTETRIG